MTVVYQSNDHNSWTSGQSKTQTLPSGTAVGDLLILAIWENDNQLNSPSGFTLICSRENNDGPSAGMTLYLYWKIATSGDVAAGNVSFTFSGSGTYSTSGMLRITGASDTVPVVAYAIDAQSGTSNPHTFTGITPVANCLLVGFGLAGNDIAFNGFSIATSDPGFTDVSQATTTLGPDYCRVTYVANSVRSSSSATGLVTVNTASGVIQTAAIIAIQPYSGVSTTVSPSVLSAAFSSQTPTILAESLKNDLVCYYKMQGNSNDSIGSKNGTDTNITYSTDYGIVDQGAKFNGLSSLISLPATAVGGNSHSISLWFKLNSANGTVLYCSGDLGRISFELHGNGDLLVSIITSTHAYVQYNMGAGSFSLGVWNHLVRTYDSTTGYLKSYLNGEEKISQLVGGNQTYEAVASDHVIGCYSYGAGANRSAFIDGNVDEVGIWSRALDSDEVSLLYNGGYGLTYPFNSISFTVGVLRAVFTITGFINTIGKGISSMKSRGEKYLMGMEDRSIL